MGHHLIQLTAIAAAGGAIGAAGRFLVGVGVGRVVGLGFPWTTLCVNVVGGFAMGLLVGWLGLRASGSEAVRVFLAVGVLGGFTTFSAFSMDVLVMLERKSHGAAAAYVFASVILAVAATFVGLWAMRQAGPA